MSRSIDEDELERWRLAGEILARINPGGLQALIVAAEVLVAETQESTPEINIVDFLA
jgi:hypothetical protein